MKNKTKSYVSVRKQYVDSWPPYKIVETRMELFGIRIFIETPLGGTM